MAEITASLVKTLREATGVSMMDCKNALVEADGDMDKATKLLRERGVAVAAKRAERTTNQGLVAAELKADGTAGGMVEVNCETDFVARNEGFQAFVKELASKSLATDKPLAESEKENLTAKIAATGENMQIRRNVRFAVQGAGVVTAYIHKMDAASVGGKVGVLLEVGCNKADTTQAATFAELTKDLALHIAFSSPKCLIPAELPKEEVDAEREIYAKQVADKPANVIDKIVEGKLRKYYSEVCLLEQPFVKENKTSIKQLLEQQGKTLGDTVSIRRFARYQIGA